MTRITTLIPAYKPDYLGEMFLGLRRQSVKDFRVILSDDSPGGAITDMIRDGRFGPLAAELNLTVVKGPGNAYKNHEHLLDAWAGSSPLVHFMLDDDVILPSFYKAHVEAHAGGRFAASISQRWLSPADGRPGWDLPLPAFVDESPLRCVPLDAARLFASCVPSCENWLGELSNIVVSAEGAKDYQRPPARGLSYFGLLDIGTLLQASQRLPLMFVRDHLSVFRQHAQQTTHATRSHGHRVAMLAWATFALHAWKERRIADQEAAQAIGITVQRCLKLYGETDEVMNRFYAVVQHQGASLARLHAAYTRFWLDFLASDAGTRPVCGRVADVAAA